MHLVGEYLPVFAICIQFVQHALDVVIFGIPQLSLLFISACQSQQLLSEPLFLVLLEPLILCSINLLYRLTNAHPSTMFPWLQRYYGITLGWIKSGYSLPAFPSQHILACNRSVFQPFLVPSSLSVHIPLGFPFVPVRWIPPVTV